MTECKYRGRVIGWLVAKSGGNLVYASAEHYAQVRTVHFGVILVRYTSPTLPMPMV